MSLLILGGTAEARALAQSLQDLPGARVSLAGATRHALPLPLPTRRGGFGGADGFADYLRAEKITAVLDATHPFAARITARSRAVCDQLGVPYRQLLRPSWAPGSRDRWHSVPNAAAAVALLPKSVTVFLATGRQTVGAFAGLGTRRVFVRVIDPPKSAFPFAEGGFIVGRPPFTLSDETALFARLGVDWLVAKNSGGAEGRAKFDAARNLGLPVAMIDRPKGPRDRVFTSVSAALDWARQEVKA